MPYNPQTNNSLQISGIVEVSHSQTKYILKRTVDRNYKD